MQFNLNENIQHKIYCALLEYKGKDSIMTGDKSFKLNSENFFSSIADFNCQNTSVENKGNNFAEFDVKCSEGGLPKLIVHHNLFSQIFKGEIEDIAFEINNEPGLPSLKGKLNLGHSLRFNSSIEEAVVKNKTIRNICNLCLEECDRDFFNIEIPDDITLSENFTLKIYPPPDNNFNGANDIMLKINSVIPVVNIVLINDEKDFESDQEHLCFYKENIDDDFIDVSKLSFLIAPSTKQHELYPIINLINAAEGYFIYNSNDPLFSQHSKKLLLEFQSTDNEPEQDFSELINLEGQNLQRNPLLCIIFKSNLKISAFEIDFWKFVSKESIEKKIKENKSKLDFDDYLKCDFMKEIKIDYSSGQQVQEFLGTTHEIKMFIMDNFGITHSLTDVEINSDPGFENDYRFYKKLNIQVKSTKVLGYKAKMDIKIKVMNRLLLTGLKCEFTFI